MIVLAHDIGVDDDAGPVLTSGTKKLTDAVGHETRLPYDASGVDAMYRRSESSLSRGAVETPATTDEPSGPETPFDWGRPRTAGNEGQASSVPACGKPARPKKPAPSLL
jgi:hypothetical protein